MKRIKIAFNTVTHESAERGEERELGWEDPLEVDDAFEALDNLKLRGAFYPSGTEFFPNLWYLNEAYQLPKTGEFITHSFHLEGFTLAEQHAIFLHLTKNQEGYFAIVRTDWVGPAFAVGLSKDHAWEVFRNTREDLGIDPKLTEAEHFECVSITKQDADAILAGDTEAWEAKV